mgnify:CR=1 FL=1
MNVQEIVVVVVLIGRVAGWLASLVDGGGRLVKYVIWGLLGSVVGGVVLPAVGVQVNLGNPLVSQVAVATIGAIILVVIARLVA